VSNFDCIDELNKEDGNLAINAPETSVIVNLQSQSAVNVIETPPHDNDDDDKENEPDSTVVTKSENIVNDDKNILQDISDDETSPLLPRNSSDEDYDYIEQELTNGINS
jgi:hypothetical protein